MSLQLQVLPFLDTLLCRAGFLNLSTADIWAWIILCSGGSGARPVHCRMFHSIPALYPRDARSTPPVSAKCPLEATDPLVENH